MELKKLGNTDIWVTPIGFGVLTIGKTQLDLPLEEGARLVRYGLSRGINFLDTAQYYETYPYIKEALKGTHYEPVIASKCLGYTYKEMEEAIEEARRELDRDVIDIFLMHEVRHDGDFENRSGAWACLADAKAKGKIRAMGISTHHVDVAEQMVSVEECELLFPLINKEGLGIRRGSGPGSAQDMARAIRANGLSGKGVFAMKVLGGGNLSASYWDCLNYVSSLDGIASIMMGFGKKEEVDVAVAFGEGTLHQDYAPDVSGKKMFIDQGDCEACGRCLKRCPNHAITWNAAGLAEIDHGICITCGYCAPVCPVRAILMY
jgi:predicted aldo/keto reductase-like oxidoreductase